MVISIKELVVKAVYISYLVYYFQCTNNKIMFI